MSTATSASPRTRLLDPAVGMAMSTLSASAKKDLLAAREEAEGFHERAAAHFGASELAHLLGLIVAVNNGNRVMVTRRIPPGGYTP